MENRIKYILHEILLIPFLTYQTLAFEMLHLTDLSYQILLRISSTRRSHFLIRLARLFL